MAKVDYSKFNAQSERWFRAFQNEDAERWAKRQFRGIMRRVSAASPPNKGSRTGAAAKKRGEATIRRDLRGRGKRGMFETMNAGALKGAARAHPDGRSELLFTTKTGEFYGVETKLYRPNATEVDMSRWHREHFRQGKVKGVKAARRSGRFVYIRKMVVPKAALGRFEKKLFRRVGAFAGGWNPGASGVGLRPSAWIARHSTPGAFHFSVSERRIRVKATNRAKHAGGLTNVRARIQIAVNEQADAIYKQIDFRLRDQARRVGFRSS